RTCPADHGCRQSGHDARVSIIVKFFVAPDDTSASLALQSGPEPAFESLSFGNFDPEEAVLEWECLLAGGSFEDLAEAGEPRIVAGQDNDGCVVFALSPRLSTALADAEHARLRDVAASWTRLRAEDGEVIGTEIADAIVGDLAAFVSSARRQNQSVYCWVA
ncbi:hypothetical protein, partial [Streptomyces exfoliatus]|uniref:hypothetical protein n=1 Tax=Streptomyces exfoliatus TaxID=1905 RepID=UPI00378758C7